MMLDPSARKWIALLAGMLVAGTAGATAQRTFVATTGLDTNPCSIALPCRGFAAAIGQTSDGGEIIVVDSGGYGAVSITKSVSIISPSGVHAGISVFGGNGVTVDAPGSIVVLRGLSINGQGGAVGVALLQAARVRIEGCVISNLTGTGIQHSATGAELVVLDTIVRDNGGSGIALVADASVVIDRVRSEHNAAQGFILAPATTEASATIADSLFSHNGSNGIGVAVVSGARGDIQVERAVMSNNGRKGFLAVGFPGGHVAATLTRNTVNRNGDDGIMISASSLSSLFASDNAVQANGGYGIHAQGTNTFVFASTNTAHSNGASAFVCEIGSVFKSLGNNNADSFGAAGGCYDTTFTGL